uniref:Uncharacterized protein n=1 Tax=Kalanchoe fedtschenkoi TaxID=63787 RepID=A0A7N0T958_KALFE
MTTSQSHKRILESYTIQPLNLIIRAGDDIILRPPVKKRRMMYVARVIEIYETKGRRKGLVNFRINVCWYYQPEDIVKIGRQPYHGAKELVQTNHADTLSPRSIEGKCTVHSLESYIELGLAGEDDYFTRSNYDIFTEAFQLDEAAVYCICNMPYNPRIMIQCEGCQEWFHPLCVHITDEQAQTTEHFFCHRCTFRLQRPYSMQ